MENWCASNTSKAVERAANRVSRAKQQLQETLEAEYPLGAAVRVVHYHGSYTGIVDGHDYYGCRVVVTNDVTGKTKKWWSRHVELLRPNTNSTER